MINCSLNIVVVGLGYVGLPLAIELSKHYRVIGFDINKDRIKELQLGLDKTNEVTSVVLKESSLELVSSLDDLKKCDTDIFIVTVPTPVDINNKPDFGPLKDASNSLGLIIKKGNIVVFESTVYPGATEDICGKIIEERSGLKSGVDFFLGYSPERINPGDKIHTVDKITKVVAGQNVEVANKLKEIYSKVTNDNVFVAKDIRTAEAAKVIENAQRDINIAFINEVAMIMQKNDICMYDVLDAANTKWNFLNFAPGLVGGHCIGVDPYYLAEFATRSGHSPEIILSGRKINEYMSEYLALKILSLIENQNKNKPKILVLGLTFKENVPDLRNTKVIDLIKVLKENGAYVDVSDPCASKIEAKKYFDIDLITSANDKYDCVVGAVCHDDYKYFSANDLEGFLLPGGVIADIKSIWANNVFNDQVKYWKL